MRMVVVSRRFPLAIRLQELIVQLHLIENALQLHCKLMVKVFARHSWITAAKHGTNHLGLHHVDRRVYGTQPLALDIQRLLPLTELHDIAMGLPAAWR